MTHKILISLGLLILSLTLLVIQHTYYDPILRPGSALEKTLRQHKSPDELKQVIGHRLKPGMTETSVDKLLTEEARGFKSLRYSNDVQSYLQGEDFLIMYYVPYKLSDEEEYPFRSLPGWEFFVWFHKDGTVRDIKMTYISHPGHITVIHELYKNSVRETE